MELTIRTLHGTTSLRSVPDDLTVDGLKAHLHDTLSSSLRVPPPEQQNLVHAGRCLEAGPLSTAGVAAGSTLVVLQTAPLPRTAPHASAPAPTAKEIRDAIFEEARRRGIEHKLSDEVPSMPHSMLGAPHDLLEMDSQLMGLIEALEGRLGGLRQGGPRGGAAGGTAPGAAAPGGDGADAASAEPEPDIVPPEPEADHISQLTDMGFSDTLARKALVLHRDRVPEAIEWLLMHGEDDDADAPITQEQLRRIYARRTRVTARAAGGSAALHDTATSTAAGAVTSALRELHMSLLQGLAGDGGGDGMDVGMMPPLPGSAVPGASAVADAMSGGGGGGGGGSGDPLSVFRRLLEQQLGDEQGEPPLPDMQSLSTLSGLLSAADVNAGVHDGNDDEDDEDEDEDDEDEDEDDNDDDGGQPDDGNAAVPL